ncbi:MAG: GGDEF domain-containing protein [Pseudomonadota bacterium]
MKLRKLTLDELPPIFLAGAGVLGVGPMLIYRLIEGSYLIATINALAVAGFVLIAWAIYFKGAVRVASVCMAMVAISAAVASITVRGGDQIIWIFPATVALFYLLKPKEAALAACVALVLIMPVIFDGNSAGKIAVFIAALTVTIALSVAFAAMTAAQRKELHATTLLDPLTGTGNRRALDQMLTQSIEQAQSGDIPFVLIMLDIDHFKSVNDMYGHGAGDLVLRNVADIVNSNIRPSDACFRAGGEEFVVVAPATELENAGKLAERLRVAIHDYAHEIPASNHPLSVTASFGVAEHVQGESRDSLYKRADDALYDAKRSGRNRLHLSARTVSLSGTAGFATLPNVDVPDKDVAANG